MQWDESHYIINNPIVKDITYFLEPSRARDLDVLNREIFRMRPVGFLTFALNYKLHGLMPEGYHAVNVAIHAANAILVYLLVLLLLGTPRLKEEGACAVPGLAFFSAIAFAVHPLSTEAVTYVFQRLASLVAMFYLASVCAYLLWRKWGGLGWYALALTTALLAFKTKENSFTIPLMLVLVETVFFRGKGLIRRLAALLPFFLLALIIPCSVLWTQPYWGNTGPVLKVNTDIPRLHYFLTELRVLVTYLRLLLLPINQNIDYAYPISTGLKAPVAVSAATLGVIFAGGLWCLLKGRPILLLTGFGVSWFFLAISVESSVIPISTVINEYRTYLPAAGLLPGAAAACYALSIHYRIGRRWVIASAAAVLILLSALTVARNSVWDTESSLWADAVSKSPRRIHTVNNLCNAYLVEGRYEEAARTCNGALDIEPYNPMTLLNLGMVRYYLGEYEEALKNLDVALLLMPDNEAAKRFKGMALKKKQEEGF
jgi:hypothetical protein